MTHVIFIRHAPAKPDKDQYSTQWQLTEESKHLCHKLAEQIKPYAISKIYTSTEAKAQSTGHYVAEKLGKLPIETAPNLQETERHSKAFYDSQADFRDAVKAAMKNPDNLLFGDETFSNARMRFVSQVEKLVMLHPEQTIAVVTHGRVLAMYLGQIMEESPVVIWEKLKMPAYVVLSWNEQIISKIQYAIEA